MKRVLLAAAVFCLPIIISAQNVEPSQQARIDSLRAEAAAKAKAAEEAAKAAQEAARAAMEAAEALKTEQQTTENISGNASQTEQPVKVDETTTNVVTAAALPVAAEAEDTKAAANARYLAEDAVPVVDGRVCWTQEFPMPGLSAAQVYDKMLVCLTAITQDKQHSEKSRIAISDKQKGDIVASMHEKMVMSSSFFSLDASDISYILHAICTDGKATVTMTRINYTYSDQRKNYQYKAEELITDHYAVNKKRTRLFPHYGKFRRHTIDLKNELFNTIANATK